jgi:Domain of unknown function (DUF2383)
MQNANSITKLLKDELSATETYQKALDELKFPGGKFLSNSLMPMFGDHKAAVSLLQEQIVKLGGKPLQNPGTWGIWPKMILENATLSGKRSAVEVLLEGEKIAEADYVAALQDSTLPATIRSLIESNLLPTQQSHVRSLDRVLEVATD